MEWQWSVSVSIHEQMSMYLHFWHEIIFITIWFYTKNKQFIKMINFHAKVFYFIYTTAITIIILKE